ncbi:MAG: hypothetical protein E7450_04860 [Ruminococcaceae bacterium]|nr:hypothetical protein [Oscillospiraceae bacterium]
MEAAFAQGESIRIIPQGTSMLPMVRPGIDSVTLSPVPEKLRKYDLPLYRRKGGQFVLHRIVKVGQTYTCIGDNQLGVERGLRHDQMLALVTAFRRGEKEIPVTALSYRIYCRVWHWSRPLRRVWRSVRWRIRRIYER